MFLSVIASNDYEDQNLEVFQPHSLKSRLNKCGGGHSLTFLELHQSHMT